MKNNLWESAKQWVKNIDLLTIHKSYLLTITVNKLRGICSGLNQKYGLCISKAIFGKSYGYMRKHELIDAIMHVKIHIASLFTSKVETRYLTKRITEIILDSGECGHVFQFNSKFDAWKFYYWINSKCEFPILKESGIYYQGLPEIYVLGIYPDILEKLINKELSTNDTSSLESEKFRAYEKIYREAPETFRKLPGWLQKKIQDFIKDKEKEIDMSVRLEPLVGF